MNSESNSQNEKLKKETSPRSIKLWLHRFKFDTPFVYVILVPYFIVFITYWFLIDFNFSIWLSGAFLGDLFLIIIFITGLYISRKVPKVFHKLIDNNKSMFYSEQNYNKYKDYFFNHFNSKIELMLPLFITLILAILYLFYDIILKQSLQYWVVSGEKLYFKGIKQTIRLINVIVWIIEVSVLSVLAFSTLLVLVFTFQCLNKLGTEEFPLNINYKDLKVGAFQNIGKFLIEVIIPPILLSTSFGIWGLLFLYVYNDIIAAYILMILGLGVASILALLLYKNTIHIHNSIVKFKNDLKVKAMNEIQKLISQENIDYEKIQMIHNYYNEILEIRDWPYNPTSIKKLTITMGSSVIPLLLSVFGLGI